MVSPATTLDRLANGTGPLYSLPAVAMQVLELTRNPQVDSHALKACIENDPALTSRILRVVNSSLYGLSRDVSDLNQALALLGTKPLKLLVLGFSLPPRLFTGVEGKILGRYWRRTLTKAIAAREIAENVWRLAGDEPFIAGLLQDVGMLVLVRELGAAYVALLEQVHVVGRDLIAAESSALGFNHTELSARLLSQWGLPQSLVAAIGWNTGETGGVSLQDPPALVQVLHLAGLVARLLADGRSEVLSELVEAGRGYRNLSRAQLDNLVSSLDEKVQQLADVLSLQLPRGTDFRDILAQAHAQLARLAGEVAQDLLFRRQPQPPPQPAEDDLLLKEIERVARAAQAAFGPLDRSARVPAEAAPAVAATHPMAPPQPAAAVSIHVLDRPPIAGAGTAQAEATAACPGLLNRLANAVIACRQARCPLSLLLAQLDHPDELIMTGGVEGYHRMRQLLETLGRRMDERCSFCAPYGEAGFALILPGCERREAVEDGNQLIAQIRRLDPDRDRHAARGVAVSIGIASVALPPKNFPSDDLLTAAARCLYGSQASGGGVVKSIEIY